MKTQTMKPLLSIAAVLLLASSALGQQKNAEPVENNLYYRALFASLEQMNKQWGKVETAQSAGTDGFRRMMVERNLYITGGLPAQSGDYRVEYLDPEQLVDRYQKLRKEFPILRASPMVNEGQRVRVSFTLCFFSYVKRRLTYALSDWSDVYFRYDCEKKQFVIDEVVLGGV
jgi:hypothetical protein